jgi:predicted Zn-dependent protease
VKKPAEPAPAAPPKPTAAPKSVLAPASEPAPATIAVFDEKIQLAIKELKAKDYAAADLLLEELEKERKGDLNVLILRAAAQNGMKYHLAARRTLEKAMRAHPKSYLPYYNLAYLMFKLEDEGVESARQYYELGRALGGPMDERIESRLK